VPRELRVLVAEFVAHNLGRAQLLFDRVAKRSPGTALKLLFEAQEYALPKLTRTELQVTPAAPAVPRQLSADPVLAAQEYLSFMNGVPFVPRAATPASPPTASTPAALAAPAPRADIPAFILAPFPVAPPASAEAAAAQPPAPVQEPAPAPRPSTKPRPGEVIVDVAPRTDQGGALVWQQPQTQEDIVNEQLRIEAARAKFNAQKRAEHEAALEIENQKAREALKIREERIAAEAARMGGE
jgi:hypothetical protein